MSDNNREKIALQLSAMKAGLEAAHSKLDNAPLLPSVPYVIGRKKALLRLKELVEAVDRVANDLVGTQTT